jgi:hypothetical protein
MAQMPIEDFKYFPIDQSARRADIGNADILESEDQPISSAARQVNAMSTASAPRGSNEVSMETAQFSMSPVDAQVHMMSPMDAQLNMMSPVDPQLIMTSPVPAQYNMMSPVGAQLSMMSPVAAQSNMMIPVSAQLKRDAENGEPDVAMETTLWTSTSQMLGTTVEEAPLNEVSVQGEPLNETSVEVEPLNETSMEVVEPDGTALKDVQSNETSVEDGNGATDEASAKDIAKEQLLKYGKPLLKASVKMTTRFGLRMLNGLAGGLIPVDGVMEFAEGFAPSPDVILGGVATTLGMVQTATDTAAGIRGGFRTEPRCYQGESGRRRDDAGHGPNCN